MLEEPRSMIAEAHEAQSRQAWPRGFLHVKGGEGKRGTNKKVKNCVPHIQVVVLTQYLTRKTVPLQCPHHRKIKPTLLNLTPVFDFHHLSFPSYPSNHDHRRHSSSKWPPNLSSFCVWRTLSSTSKAKGGYPCTTGLRPLLFPIVSPVIN